jgi:hypothetical protein
MIVLSAERDGIAVNLMIQKADGEIVGHLIMDGAIESRVAAYGLKSEMEALEVLLIEWNVLPDGELLPAGDNDAIRAILTKHRSEVRWADGLDRNEVLANMRLPKESADLVKLAAVQDVPAGSMFMEDQERAAAQEAYAAGHQRFLEERVADDFVSALPTEVLAQPRKLGDSGSDSSTVGLSIQIVP